MQQLARVPWDLIVIGGGHNGLVMAAHAAAAGKRTLVLERRDVLGGACVSEEFAGCLITRTSYVLSMFPKRLMKSLRLQEDHGLVLLDRNPNSFTPLRDGRYLLRYKEAERTDAEIAKFSRADVAGYRKMMSDLSRLSHFVEHVMTHPAPDPFRKRDWPAMLSMLMKARGLGRADLALMMKLATASAYDFVSGYISSEPLVGAVTSDGIIGTAGGPFTPGTGYVLVHHDMGDLGEERGEWFIVQGGMGGLAKALASCARSRGATIMTGADVERVLTRKTRGGAQVEGVQLADGRILAAKAVVSSADAWQTLGRMCDPADLPEDVRDGLKRIDYSSMSFKANIVIERTPRRKLEWACGVPTPCGTIHLLEDARYVQRCYHEAWEGRVPKDLVLEVTVPSVRDRTIAPDDRDVISVFGQYVPYKPGGKDWDEALRRDLLAKTRSVMARYCNIDDVWIDGEVLTPQDLEKEFRLTGGNIFQGAMRLDQLLFMRPLPGYSDYATPVRGLFLCGAATHPGGGVTGINATLAWNRVRRYI